jgi:hypothetical protein
MIEPSVLEADVNDAANNETATGEPVVNERRQEVRLVLALAAGASASAAAKRAGCSRRTVFRRLEDAEFRRAVARARGQIISRATSLLARTSAKAVATLQKLLDDANASVRRMAAKSLLDSLARLSDLAEVEERIAELELALTKGENHE